MTQAWVRRARLAARFPPEMEHAVCEFAAVLPKVTMYLKGRNNPGVAVARFGVVQFRYDLDHMDLVLPGARVVACPSELAYVSAATVSVDERFIFIVGRPHRGMRPGFYAFDRV